MKYKFLLFFFLFNLVTAFAQDNEAALAEQYFLDKEYDSALELYEKLYKKEPKEGYVNRILTCYEAGKRFEDAALFMDKAIKKQPDMVLYPVMKASLLEKTGNFDQAALLYKEILEKKLRSETDFQQVATFLYKTGKLEEAEKTYIEGRKKLKNPTLFNEEMGRIYEVQGMTEKATYEYINEYYNHRETFENMNLVILNMAGNSKTADAAIEKVLLDEVERNPGDLGVRKILYEYYVLAKNFQEAFIQVKSIDKYFREDGQRVFKFAETMRNNKFYDLSNQAYDYLIQNKLSSPYYQNAFFEKATNGELRAFEQIPPDQKSIAEAVKAYSDLLNQFGKRSAYFSAIYRKANLEVFYLNQLDEPLAELTEAVTTLRDLPRDEWAKAKLLIADILLIKKDYNAAKLIYNEVSDAFKDRQTGALAKFRLAQLAYYKGEFEMATGLLSAIKDNTSNDISNDAIQLNLRIIDNTGLDTITTALAMFAQAQLLVYQRDYKEGMALMDSLMYKFPNHSLTDEIYWEKANIYLKENDIPKTLEYLDKILSTFKEDIYGDDALYTKARLFDYNMKDSEGALKYYLEFLSAYPGSLYSVEVRKRIRELRKEG